MVILVSQNSTLIKKLLSCVEEKMKKNYIFWFLRMVKTISVFQSNQLLEPLYSICVKITDPKLNLWQTKKLHQK